MLRWSRCWRRVRSNGASRNLPNLDMVGYTDVESSGCALRHPLLNRRQHHLLFERHQSFFTFLNLHIHYYIMPSNAEILL